jgi:hypothetical protein
MIPATPENRNFDRNFAGISNLASTCQWSSRYFDFWHPAIILPKGVQSVEDLLGRAGRAGCLVGLNGAEVWILCMENIQEHWGMS